MSASSPNLSGARSGETLPGWQRFPADEKPDSEPPVDLRSDPPVDLRSDPPGAAPDNGALAMIEVRGQRFILERTSRGRYDVRSLEAHARAGTITFSGGCMQLTAEKILMATMVEVARVALQLGAL